MMNKEEIIIKGIDEIPMFSWNTKTKEFYVLGHKFDGVNSIEDFINYIHNLDNKNKDLQQRKEKAIDKLYCWGEVLDPEFQKEMLEILGDKE